MTLSLREAIARVPMWAGASDIRTQPLGGGITNQNFRVDVNGESFVLRIGGEKTELLGIDRRNEYAATQAAASIGLAPEVVYFIEPEGYLVTRFVAGHPLPPQELGRPENIRRVANALKEFHRLAAIPASFSPFDIAQRYINTARQFSVRFPENFSWSLARILEIRAALSREPVTPRPCHNDLLNENFIEDGRVRILDWEYAGMGDPAFDLANLAVHHGFTDEQDHFLLECYHGLVSPRRLARHKLLKSVSDFREATWGLVQIGISKLDFDFRDYADRHFTRMDRNIRDPRYGQWLGEFNTTRSATRQRMRAVARPPAEGDSPSQPG